MTEEQNKCICIIGKKKCGNDVEYSSYCSECISNIKLYEIEFSHRLPKISDIIHKIFKNIKLLKPMYLGLELGTTSSFNFACEDTGEVTNITIAIPTTREVIDYVDKMKIKKLFNCDEVILFDDDPCCNLIHEDCNKIKENSIMITYIKHTLPFELRIMGGEEDEHTKKNQ